MFNNAGSRSDYIASNGRISELERIWKEAIVAQFEVQSWHLAGCTEEVIYSLNQVPEPRFEPRTSRICSRSLNHMTSFGERYVWPKCL
jgi:hypothetical protein